MYSGTYRELKELRNQHFEIIKEKEAAFTRLAIVLLKAAGYSILAVCLWILTRIF